MWTFLKEQNVGYISYTYHIHMRLCERVMTVRRCDLIPRSIIPNTYIGESSIDIDERPNRISDCGYYTECS